MKYPKDALDKLLARPGVRSLGIDAPGDASPPPAPEKGRQARYTRSKPEAMNKLERRYADHLEAGKIAGRIHDWAFEPEKFRLANKGDACFYTPDFRVLLIDGTVEFHDTKGFMEEDANIKIKWFVAQHPYPLVVVRWIKGRWEYDRREP